MNHLFKELKTINHTTLAFNEYMDMNENLKVSAIYTTRTLQEYQSNATNSSS